ncbi:MAG: DUF115 domain-containing protein [Desulfurellales bacterium]|nr:MAG: DUF115 domain-containing protein [Desulfurellales bacterium]
MSGDHGSEGVAERHPLYRKPKVDFVMRHRNEGTTEDLVIPVTLICNTDDEVLISNIRANSRLDRKWIGTTKAHEGIAVICGGGPSLEEDLGLIDALHAQGATIFALNGAAGYLASKGIWADYQVIVDAREQTKDLIGPAKEHLFGSQVHPVLFKRVPEASLFHVNSYADHNDFVDLLPEHDGEYILVGSHGSVGNVALALAYGMGYRDLRCFGYDSSHRQNEGHAYAQPMNDLEPITKTEFGGKTYISTFTMKGQANVFPRLAKDLIDLGCKITVHGSGLLPDMWNSDQAKTVEQREEDKYTEMWGHPDYRNMSPADDHVTDIIDRLRLSPGVSVIDFGCGTGRATKKFQNYGCNVVGVDIATNALETEIPFVKAILWNLPAYLSGDYGVCCDVMEHIPTEKVGDVIRNIAQCVEKGVYFRIDFFQDEMGAIIGKPLHLTVRPPAWWKAQLHAHFKTVIDDGSVFICWH